MFGRKPWVRWPPASRRHAEHPLVAERAAQRRPVGVGEVVDVLGAGLLQRRQLDPLGEDRPEGDQVGVDARVRLHVGVRGAEQLAGVLGGERLDGVDVLAAGVEAVPDGALGVLVAEPVAHGEQHGGAGVVLAGDQLERLALVGELLADRVGDPRLDGADHLQRAAVGVRGRGGVEGRWVTARGGRSGHGGLLAGVVNRGRPGARQGGAGPLPGGCPPLCASHGPR